MEMQEIQDTLVSYSVTLTGAAGSLSAEGGQKMERQVKLSVYGASGRLVAEGEAAAAGCQADGELRVPNVRLWKVRDAYLYRFRIRLYENGNLADEYWEDQGIVFGTFWTSRFPFFREKTFFS